MEMFKDKPDDDEVRGHGDGIYTKRGHLLAQTQPQEEIQQPDVQEIVEEVTVDIVPTTANRNISPKVSRFIILFFLFGYKIIKLL